MGSQEVVTRPAASLRESGLYCACVPRGAGGGASGLRHGASRVKMYGRTPAYGPRRCGLASVRIAPSSAVMRSRRRRISSRNSARILSDLQPRYFGRLGAIDSAGSRNFSAIDSESTLAGPQIFDEVFTRSDWIVMDLCTRIPQYLITLSLEGSLERLLGLGGLLSYFKRC